MTEETPAERPRTSTRDRETLRARLEAWLAERLPAGAAPDVAALDAPASNGMSSETLLFDAAWGTGADRVPRRLVARVAPDPEAVPVFPRYDLDEQARVIRLVGELSRVPVPRVLWSEPDPAPLGAPFFVMERVDGLVPPDILPYTFDANWVSEGTPEQLDRLERGTVEVLARLHAIPAEPFAFLGTGPDGALRHHVDGQRAYLAWVVGARPAPLLERTLAWLETRWPEEGPTVLSWGDSRIGNMMYRDFEPVAVLDWEMAALAPREVDLGWLLFLHRFFEDLAIEAGLPGMPGLLQRDRVTGLYREASGHTPCDLEWFMVYAALRHGIVMTRVGLRSVHFAEREMPTDLDELVMHRASLEAMLDGSYWARLP